MYVWFVVNVHTIGVRQLIRSVWFPVIVVTAVFCLNPLAHGEREKREVQDYVALTGAPGSKEQKARDVFELAQQVPVEEVPMLFLVCGGQDGGVDQTHAFLQVLAKRRIPYEYREISPRGHEWRIWNEEIPVFLDKLERLDGFEPLREQAAERHAR